MTSGPIDGPGTDSGVIDAPADPDAPQPGDGPGGADGAGEQRRPAPLFQPVRFIQVTARGGSQLDGTTLAIGDLTGDGRQDVALAQDRGGFVGEPGPRLSLFVQGADGSLGLPRTTELPIDHLARPTSMVVMDFDGDQRQDLVMAHDFGGLLLFKQGAAGTLEAPTPHASRETGITGEPYLLATGHFDGDKLLDVVAATDSGSFSGDTYQDGLLYTQQPGGGLAAPRPLVILRNTHSALAVGDLDGNGLTDVAVASDSPINPGKLGVLRQTTPGTWAAPVDHFVAAGNSYWRIQLAIGDVTGDGRSDLVATYGDSAGWVAVLRQNGDGQLGPPELVPVDSSPRGLCLADFDQDGRLDVAVLHPSRGVGVLRQRAGGGLAREELYRARAQVDNTISPMACGDVSGDGRPDVSIIHGQGLELLLNRTRPDDSSACGAAGQPCCPDSRCDPSALCGPLEICLPCGGTGQPCCGESCRDPGSRCVGQQGPRSFCEACPPGQFCDACGAVGQRCCAAPAAACTGAQVVCQRDSSGTGGLCVPCGGPGQACCPGATCQDQGCCHQGTCVQAGSACGRDADHAGICRAGSCDGCGLPGHTCCAPQAWPGLRVPAYGTCRASTQACDLLDTFFNSANFCADCGGPGQPCCGGNVCSGGGCCEDNVCIAAGTACRDMNGTCSQGSCGACGGPDQPCCNGIRCTAAGMVCRSEPVTTGDRRCRSCGERGQACCAGGCRPGLSCNYGVCE